MKEMKHRYRKFKEEWGQHRSFRTQKSKELSGNYYIKKLEMTLAEGMLQIQ